MNDFMCILFYFYKEIYQKGINDNNKLMIVKDLIKFVFSMVILMIW